MPAPWADSIESDHGPAGMIALSGGGPSARLLCGDQAGATNRPGAVRKGIRMTLVEILGYLALLLLLASAAMRTIIWLRILAISANLAIVAYGIVTARYPITVFGAVILLINAWRLWEMRKLVALTRQATAAGGAPLTVDWLLPYMRPLALPADTVLFRKGDAADAMYFISRGRMRFDELGIELGEGSLFGEIGLFSDHKVRTASAKSLGPCSLMVVSAERVRELFFQNPEFGFFLVGLITRRLSEDAAAGTLKP
jgi:CRP/FNR family transcriptional regulator, cyclic AMP receptor protein